MIRSAPVLKWTSTSEPSGSVRSQTTFSRRSAGASDSSVASSKSSGRIPRITSRPTKPARPLRLRTTWSSTVSRCSPKATWSLPSCSLELRRDQVDRRRADEAGDELVPRVVVEHLRRVDLLQVAGVHDGDAVAHRHRLDLVVRDVDRRHAEAALQLVDLGAQLDAELRVQVRERLVHQEGLRLADDRAAHRHALPLAARERARLALEELLDLEDARGLLDALLDLLLRQLAQLQPEGEVVLDGHVRIERVALEDHRDVAVLRRQVVDDLVADPDLAVADLLEPGQHAQRGRLAAAGRADEHHQLAVPDLEVEVVHRLRAVGVDLRDRVVCDLRHARISFARSTPREPGGPRRRGWRGRARPRERCAARPSCSRRTVCPSRSNATHAGLGVEQAEALAERRGAARSGAGRG